MAHPTHDGPGKPWPGAKWGEVRGPSGRRTFTAERAAELIGLSERRVRQMGDTLGSESDPASHSRIYLDAERVITEAKRRGLWPPQDRADHPVDEDVGDWQQLAAAQSEQIEHLLRELEDLKQELSDARMSEHRLRGQLDAAIADREDLSLVSERLARVIQRSVSSRPDASDVTRE